jgi:hypothetical protein
MALRRHQRNLRIADLRQRWATDVAGHTAWKTRVGSDKMINTSRADASDASRTSRMQCIHFRAFTDRHVAASQAPSALAQSRRVGRGFLRLFPGPEEPARRDTEDQRVKEEAPRR